MNAKLHRLLAASMVVLLAGCVDEYIDLPTTLLSFEVEVVSLEEIPPGQSTAVPIDLTRSPLPIPRGTVRARVVARAWGTDGQPFPWDGMARIHVTPGTTVLEKTPIYFTQGQADAVIEVRAVHSDTRIWVIDDIDDGTPRSFAAGVSQILPFDQPTLADANTIPPQGNNSNSLYTGDFLQMTRAGPVWKERTRPEDPCEFAVPGPAKRDLIVTAITSTGFYVTDLAEPANATYPGNFGHIFVYNFSYPEGLHVGDRLEHLQGTLTDFAGNTQLTFPGWRVSDCPRVPGDDENRVRAMEREAELAVLATLEADPPAIDEALCTRGTNASASRLSCGYSTQNLHMESLESSLVQIPEVVTPDLWVRCDFDGDGETSNFTASGTPFACPDPRDAECACVLACQTSAVFPAPGSPFESTHADKAFDATGKTCSELTSYDTFGQYTVRIVSSDGTPGPRINLTSRDAIPDFDPTAPESRGSRLWVRGILLQVLGARPRWVVSVRNESDLCCLPEDGACPEGLQLCR